MKFQIDKCPRCGKTQKLMFSNNPLVDEHICFSCISKVLKYDNIEHADFFCRTYNLPLVPELWITIADESKEGVFELYTEMILDDPTYQPNLAYGSTTKDTWAFVNKEWEKLRTMPSILDNIAPLKESYVERGRLKWGKQYTYGDIIKMDGMYIKTLRSNNITNPLQKEAVKTLCKIQVELDEAIAAKDAKAIKDFSTAYATFAKQADLETMINETKTEDITTVSELYQYMEELGYIFKYYDGVTRDEADKTIKDINDTLRRCVMESTTLGPVLEQMIKDKQKKDEEEYASKVSENESLEEILGFNPEDAVVDKESDDEILNMDFSEDSEIDTGIKIINKEG